MATGKEESKTLKSQSFFVFPSFSFDLWCYPTDSRSTAKKVRMRNLKNSDGPAVTYLIQTTASHYLAPPELISSSVCWRTETYQTYGQRFVQKPVTFQPNSDPECSPFQHLNSVLLCQAFCSLRFMTQFPPSFSCQTDGPILQEKNVYAGHGQPNDCKMCTSYK